MTKYQDTLTQIEAATKEREKTKREIIYALIRSPKGREKLCASMVQPTNTRLAMSSALRRCLLTSSFGEILPHRRVAELEHEELVLFDDMKAHDPEAFDVASVERALDKCLETIRDREHDLFEVALREALGDSFLKMQRSLFKEDPKAAMNMLKMVMDRVRDHIPEELLKSSGHGKILCNARDYAEIRKHGRDELETWTGGYMRCGKQGTFDGFLVITQKLVPVGTIYVLPNEESAGKVRVVSELTTTDTSRRTPEGSMWGLKAREEIQVWVNPKTIAALKIEG